MYLGNMVELGPGDPIYENPVHPYTRALLSATPVADPRAKLKDRIVLQGDVPSPTNKPSGCGFRTRCPLAEPSCSDEAPAFQSFESGRHVACPHVEE